MVKKVYLNNISFHHASYFISVKKDTHISQTIQHSHLTGANANESIVCILAETDLGKIGSFPINWLPASVQNLTWLTPTLTNCTSESGRNWARKIRLTPLLVAAILSPKSHNMDHLKIIPSYFK